MKRLLLALFVMVVGFTSAHAVPLVLPDLVAPLADVSAWFTIILGGLAVMWGYRKLTGTTNRT